MSEYYGISTTPMDDYLAHYGVKGMKWGVRRALKKSGAKGEKRLAKQYEKAQKKLQKLNDRTDVAKQNELSKKYDKAAKTHAKVAAAGLGVMGAGSGAYTLSKLAGVHFQNKRAAALNSAANSQDYTAQRLYGYSADHYSEVANKAWGVNDRLWNAQRSPIVKSAIGGVTAGAALTSALNKGKSIAAKKRTTTKGHAKAVAKRDAWKKEMKSAFKGTQYEGIPKVNQNKKRRRNKT